MSKSKEKALQYENLFACCDGGQRESVEYRRRICCCDAKKHDAIITIDPRNQEMMKYIMYYSDGRIDIQKTCRPAALRNKLRQDLLHHLGLNGSVKNDGTCLADTATELVKRRKDAYLAAESMLETLEKDGNLSLERVEEEISEMQSADIWDEYIGVTIFVLRQGV